MMVLNIIYVSTFFEVLGALDTMVANESGVGVSFGCEMLLELLILKTNVLPASSTST
jgi:ethanolamine transporter EutH